MSSQMKKRTIGVGITLIVLLVVCAGLLFIGQGPDISTQTSASELVDEFGCQWIVDTWRAELGALMLADLNVPDRTIATFAVMHVYNEMNAERGYNFAYQVGAEEVAEALEYCYERGY